MYWKFEMMPWDVSRFLVCAGVSLGRLRCNLSGTEWNVDLLSNCFPVCLCGHANSSDRLSLWPRQTRCQCYWWLHPGYLAFPCFSCRLHCQWQAVCDLWFLLLLFVCFRRRHCQLQSVNSVCRKCLINVVDVGRLNMNIKSDVWLTVHRNSVWIRKTN